MPANTAPIFGLTPNIGFCRLTAANTAKDGTGTVGVAFTAGSNGGYCESVVIRPAGTNVASVARIFLNNGGSNATPSNNTLVGEVGLPATTNSEVAAIVGNEYVLNKKLPAGWRVLITLGTAVAGGYDFTGCGADY